MRNLHRGIRRPFYVTIINCSGERDRSVCVCVCVRMVRDVHTRGPDQFDECLERSLMMELECGSHSLNKVCRFENKTKGVVAPFDEER